MDEARGGPQQEAQTTAFQPVTATTSVTCDEKKMIAGSVTPGVASTVNDNLETTEGAPVFSKPLVERHDELEGTCATGVEGKLVAATAATLVLLDTPIKNENVETMETASDSNKRAHEEGVEDTALHESHLRKRAAIGNDESTVPSSGQTTDETVGDSSDDVEMIEAKNEEELLGNDTIHASEEDTSTHEEFFRNLDVNQQVDVYDVRTKDWLAAKIVHLGEDGFTVHYMGWNVKCDEKIAKSSSSRIQARATKAITAWAKHQAKIDKRKVEKKVEATPSVDGSLGRLGAEQQELAPAFVQTGLTRSGRAITKRVENGALKPKAPPKKKKDAAVVESGFPEEDLCGVCGEIEDDELTDMILCDGGCLKSYHFSCLGIDSAPEGKEWLCEQCRTNEQLCFSCGRNGTINEKGGVFRCSAPSCGKFFHQTCIDANKMSRRAGGKTKPGSTSMEELLKSDASFRCPRHVCFVCEGKKKSPDLMCCLKCPESYHPQCVPPSARYNSVGLLCWRHFAEELPKIPSFYLSDRNIDTVTVDSSLHLPWMFLPKRDPDASNPNDCHHFRLLKNIIEDVRLQPPTYRKLGRSIYTFKQPKVSLEDAPTCVCKERCGDDCINRLSFTECFGPAPTPGMKFNKHNRESNCMLGENCGNRALHQKVYPRFQKFHTVEKGWALRLLEPAKAGQLVIEYVGEVINEEEKERRLLDHAKNSPEDKNMYIMELGKGEYIDARFKGSVSRFINHSCDPNCHLLKWRVKGVNRIAITALKDIEPGTELSYDYQFHTKQAMEWKCHCKAKNCRGTMAPEKINQAHESPVKKLTKKEQIKQRKRALMQEKLQQGKEIKSTARRLSLTAHVSMGDRTTIEKMAVRTGPATRELEWAKYYHLFNIRDAKHGFNFKLRKEMRDLRIAHQEHVKRELVSVSGSTTAASSRSVSPARLSGNDIKADQQKAPEEPAEDRQVVTRGVVASEPSLPMESLTEEVSVDRQEVAKETVVKEESIKENSVATEPKENQA
ncbi:SET domain-containing protein [Phytophthora infestans]|uniref:SET domain-containing protein n=1 Tax=Phytophthora infestans TaxID=4787 RepID=A0A833W4T3_PHYIN|nr:SET domain-containing protein [Phytophthora infestans]KAF4138053.1 SET domain-containing protein [Phytophthora infestans]